MTVSDSLADDYRGEHLRSPASQVRFANDSESIASILELVRRTRQADRLGWQSCCRGVSKFVPKEPRSPSETLARHRPREMR